MKISCPALLAAVLSLAFALPAAAAPFSLDQEAAQDPVGASSPPIVVYRLQAPVLDSLVPVTATAVPPPSTAAAPQAISPSADLPPMDLPPIEGLSPDLSPAQLSEAAAAADAAFKSLLPPAGAASSTSPPAAVPGAAPALSAARIAQLKEILAPLQGVEYPSLPLFEAALDARLRAYARRVALDAALKAHKSLSSGQLDSIQTPDWKALSDPKISEKMAKPAPNGKVSLRDLTSFLLPYGLRQWVLDQAAASHALAYTTPVAWSGEGMGTYFQNRVYPVYGFYPLWRDPKTPGKPDKPAFSVLSRISLFAFSFDANGDLSAPAPDAWSTDLAAFLAEADRHGTQVDFTLYRDDWSFLRGLGAEDRRKIALKVAENAKALLDTPLPGLFARAKAWVIPFTGTKRLAGGLTLWLVPPDPADGVLSAGFTDFYADLTRSLASTLGPGPEARPYTLNLVICDPQSASASASAPRFFESPCFNLRSLYSLETSTAQGKNLAVKFIVPLPEPVFQSAEALRGQIVNNADQIGGPKNIPSFLQTIVPLFFLASGLPVPPAPEQEKELSRQIKNNLGLVDSFYNVAFWPAPLQGDTLPTDLDKILWEKEAFLPGITRPGPTLEWITEHRWWFRAFFDVLLLIVLIALPFVLRMHLEDLGLLIQLGLLASLSLLAGVGVLLLECDPDMDSVRQGNVPLFVLFGVLVLGVLFAILRSREAKP
jgi:hypothetical protein